MRRKVSDFWPPTWARRAGGSRTSRSSTGAPEYARAEIEHQQRLLAERLATLDSSPPACHGRGIVTAIGGDHIVGGWVLLSFLRQFHHCHLPVEVWYLGESDLPPAVRAAFDRFDVTFVDASRDRRVSGPSPTNGWALKSSAIAFSRFAEVLWLDADLLPLSDPVALFDEPEYRGAGALFWPDIRRVNRFNPIWSIAGTTPPDGPEFESGIVVLDKKRHWPNLQLMLHFNQQSSFYYRYLLGDKDTYQLAWRLRDAPNALPARPAELARGPYPADPPDELQRVGLWQHNFAGERIALHQTDTRLVAWGRNPIVPDFPYTSERDAALAELRGIWDGALEPRPTPRLLGAEPTDIEAIRCFVYILPGIESRALELLPGGQIGNGAREMERFWRIEQTSSGPLLILSSRKRDCCRLQLQVDGSWRGHWLENERVPAELIPQATDALRPSGRSARRPTLLYITPVAPAETGNGVSMRAAQVLRMLTESHDVSVLILPLYQKVASASPPSWMVERCTAIRWAPPPVWYDETTVAPNEYDAWQEAWADEIGRAYPHESFDTIHLFRTSSLTLARAYLRRPDLQRARLQLDLDDIESRTQSRIAALYGRRGAEAEQREATRQARTALQIEHYLLTEWDRLFVCSDGDRIALEQRLPRRRAEISVLPNRVHLPPALPPCSGSAPLTILYVGTLSYFPNADGLHWFCREVLPRIREWSTLDIRLLVVGSGATDGVRELAHIPEVEIIGEVDRLDPWYARADLVIVPLRAGGGTRIKLIEALAYQRPVVSTTLAAEGLDVHDGTHLLIGDRPAVFARHCLHLLEDRDLAAHLARNGRTLVEQRYAISKT